MNEVQEKCNEVIRNSLEVSVKNFNVGDPELDEVSLNFRQIPRVVSNHLNPFLFLTDPVFYFQLHQKLDIMAHILRGYLASPNKCALVLTKFRHTFSGNFYLKL